MKKLVCLLLAVLLMVGAAGCWKGEETASEKSSVKTEKVEDIKRFAVSDVKINTSAFLLDGEKVVGFSYDNETEYSISNVRIRYRLKSTEFIDSVKALSKKFEEANFDDFYIEGECLSITDPGNLSSKVELYINDDECVDTESIFDFLTPESLFVEYIDDGYIKQIQHEYESEQDIYSEDDEIAYQWSDSVLASMLPKPEAKIVSVLGDYDDSFIAYFRVSSAEQYDSYVQSCKEIGFTLEDYSSSTTFSSKNEDGYGIRISYYDWDFEVRVALNAPEN